MCLARADLENQAPCPSRSAVLGFKRFSGARRRPAERGFDLGFGDHAVTAASAAMKAAFAAASISARRRPRTMAALRAGLLGLNSVDVAMKKILEANGMTGGSIDGSERLISSTLPEPVPKVPDNLSGFMWLP
jgi:hypothetical protein